MPFFGTNPFAAPGLGLIAAAVMLGCGLAWLHRAQARARAAGEGYSYQGTSAEQSAAESDLIRERAVAAREFDPSEIARGAHAPGQPSMLRAALPLMTVVAVNLLMSFAVLPMLSVASLVGFGAVIAALPSFEMVKQWVLGIEGGPLVSLAVATNLLAALTGSASGGLTIALDALAPTYMQLAHSAGIDPGLMHRVAVIGAGTLDSLPHNGAVVTLLAVCGARHRGSYGDIVMAAVVGPLIALAVVIALGSVFGAF
jgi:hypothetical protein